MLSETAKILHEIKQEVDLKVNKYAVDTRDNSQQKLTSKPPLSIHTTKNRR